MTKEELQIENKLLKKQIEGYRKVLYNKSGTFDRDRLEIKRIANENGISLNDVLCGARDREIMTVKRKIANFFRAKNYTYDRIALILWYSNHVSIIHLCKY